MLRFAIESGRSGTEIEDERWRVSLGSAGVLGLRDVRMDAPPTTAYLMLGERCSRNCAFCTQARESHAEADALSRVTWPAHTADQVAEAVADAHREGRIERVCFQVTVSHGYLEQAYRAVRRIASLCAAPICVSVAPRCEEDVATLLGAGAERVTIALDAACERVYREAKGGAWLQTLALLEICAQHFPGRIGTHLIAGLGETERELIERMQAMHDLGVTIGLFAFTPATGVAWAERQPPSLASYRRIQAARWLIVHNLARTEDWRYDMKGMLIDFNVEATRLSEWLFLGDAFRTAGCAACNRPYYNERPGGVMYNYPRPLTPIEAEREVEALIQSLRGSPLR